MSRDFEIHNLANLSEEEMWEAVDELKSMVNDEIEWRDEIKKRELVVKVETSLYMCMVHICIYTYSVYICTYHIWLIDFSNQLS